MRASEEPPAQGLRAVFRKVDITPAYPVSLLGYFTERLSTGVLDPLYCRMAAVAAEGGRPARSGPWRRGPARSELARLPGRARRSCRSAARPAPARRDRLGRRRTGSRAPTRPAPVRRLLFIQIDTCLIENGFAWLLRRALRRPEAGRWAEREVLLFANHTHTAPALMNLYEARREERYAAGLLRVLAVEAGAAARTLAEASPSARAPAATVWAARGRAEGLAFNRRWLLRDGRLLTNPPRGLRAQLARTEGPVDPELDSLLFRDAAGRPLALFLGVANHADTIGGDRISADWTGVLEREICRDLGSDIPVFPLLGAQGNINHFDLSSDRDQTCYAEAQRLGRAYATAVLEALPRAEPLSAPPRRPALGCAVRRVRVPGRRIPSAELSRAKALAAAGERETGGSKPLTAVELAEGSEAVRRILAGELLRIAPGRRRACRVPLQVARLGGAVFFAFPGEPFAELGLALKGAAAARGARLAIPLGLANGYYGYILPGESLLRGGYEALSVSGSLGGCTAARLVSALAALGSRV